MSGSTDLHQYYLNGGIPDEIAENLKDLLPEHDGLSIEEVLLHQASVYHSFQEYSKSSDLAPNSSRSSQLSSQDCESSHRVNTRSQEELDEAVARSLQEMGDDFDKFYIHSHSSTANGNTGSPVAAPATVEAPSREVRQDEIDPDNMTFEELLALRDTVGVESKGVPETVISMLPSFKYREGVFSKKKKKEDCVICQMTYSNAERLTTLPCAHQYHSKCINEWLKLSKNCPVCQKEVI